jgi:hypothetical protein
MMDNHQFDDIKKKLRLTNQGISDVMGVRLRTVANWAEGVWKMPLVAERFLHTLLSIKRDAEAMIGTSEATYVVGYKQGIRSGRLDQVEGYTKGYDDGYREGCAVELRRGYVAALGD